MHAYVHDFDPNGHRAGYLPATDYALPHLSRFTVAHDADTPMLRHVNCGLLSTPGVPPTLLALKQHAQSLSYLIAMLDPHAGGDDDAIEVLVARAERRGQTEQTEKRAKTERTEPPKKHARVATATKTGPDDDDDDGPGTALFRKTASTAIDGNLPDSSGGLRCLVTGARRGGVGDGDGPFDWLDLRRPYTNDADPDHHRPLVDLVNEVQAHDGAGIGLVTYHCPLATFRPRNAYGGGGQEEGEDDDGRADTADAVDADGADQTCPRLYASHHNLLLHANLCLERLDHDYAATGGLLSLLPTAAAGCPSTNGTTEPPESPLVIAARNTLVGQWLVFTQQLVGRMHELEIAYSQAVQLLVGETVLAPLVAKGSTGEAVRMSMGTAMDGKGEPEVDSEGRAVNGAARVDGASAASVASIAAIAPSDAHWILANAGDRVWEAMHDRLDAAAAAEAAAVARRRAEGVVGLRSVSAATGGADNHLVCVELPTRFYRTATVDGRAGGTGTSVRGRGPILVCLASAVEAGEAARSSLTSAARVDGGHRAHELNKDHSVDVPPLGTAHLLTASALERRYDGQLRAAAGIARTNTRLAQRLVKRTHVLLTLRRDHARLRAQNAALQAEADDAAARLRHVERKPAPRKSGGRARGETSERSEVGARSRARPAIRSTAWSTARSAARPNE